MPQSNDAPDSALDPRRTMDIEAVLQMASVAQTVAPVNSVNGVNRGNDVNEQNERVVRDFALLALLAVLVCAVAGCGGASTPAATPIAHASATATTATSKPTSTPKTAAGCQETRAVFGGPISAFIATYGPSQATDPALYDAPLDASRSADIMIRPATGCVMNLVLAAFNATWDDSQTIAACAPFLPPGATQFNAAGPYIDFHSTLGEIVEQHAAGSCALSIAPS